MKLFNAVNEPETISKLDHIQKVYEIDLPPKYRSFFEIYYPYDLSKIAFDERIYYIDLFNMRIFGAYFMPFEDLEQELEVNFQANEEMFGWKLLPLFKCGVNPHAGFYVGYGESNKDVVYYVDEERISPNFKYPLDTENLPANVKRSVTRVAKDAFSFLEFLCVIPNQIELLDYDNLI